MMRLVVAIASIAALAQFAAGAEHIEDGSDQNLQLVQMSATKTKLTTRTKQNPAAFEDGEGPQTIFPAGCEGQSQGSGCYHQNKTLALFLEKYVAQSGGRAQIQFVGDSTVESIWKKFNESGNFTAGLELVYTSASAITTASASWFSAEATATLFNFGLHCLHVHPYRSCIDDHPSLYQDCGNYADTFATLADLIHTRAPKSKMVWKTTSHVCPTKFESTLRDGLFAWDFDKAETFAGEALGSAHIDMCQEDCPQFAKGSGRRCEDELFNDVGVKHQHDVSMEAVGKLDYNVSVLDAFASTSGQCDKSLDGKHYSSLDWGLAIELAHMLLGYWPS